MAAQLSSDGRRAPGRWVEATLIAIVRGYQWAISPWLGPRCRFQPTCSDYAITAVRRHGALRGCWLAGCRILRCHPWGGTGYDPVPEYESPRADRE